MTGASQVPEGERERVKEEVGPRTLLMIRHLCWRQKGGETHFKLMLPFPLSSHRPPPGYPSLRDGLAASWDPLEIKGLVTESSCPAEDLYNPKFSSFNPTPGKVDGSGKTLLHILIRLHRHRANRFIQGAPK
jgi:hypothetical protein